MKKKRLAKHNQHIRALLGDEGFDSGIERISTPTLQALVQFLDLACGSERVSLLKVLRRAWSEGEKRGLIVDFLRQRNDTPAQREEHLENLLEGYSHEEKRALHQAFLDTPLHKITPEKILKKKLYLTLQARKEELQTRLNGHFTYDDRLEFFAPIEYHIGTTSFRKIHVLYTPSSPIHDESTMDELVSLFTQRKEETIQRFQAMRDQWCTTLLPHRYLDTTTIIRTIQSAPPETILPPLNETILSGFIHEHYPDALCFVHESDIALSISHQLTLHERTITYDVTWVMDRPKLEEAIWLQNDIDYHSEHDTLHAHMVELFDLQYRALVDEVRTSLALLYLDESALHAEILKDLIPQLEGHLHITPSLHKRLLKELIQAHAQEIQKAQRRELLARSVRDFKNLFPLARSLRRRLILHIGPTNSGKTYRAMEHLKKAQTGYYLAPLRLLALEGYEQLRTQGLKASLITGEEQLLDDAATHISSTIEMVNFEVDVEVCVIDEVQMIDDRDRGWAWANAIIGAPASTIIMTGAPHAREAIEALSHYLAEPLEVITFERKNPLHLLTQPITLEAIPPQSALIVFTRANALRLQQRLASQCTTSVIYGNLSPEVRREEARRFREGESEILIATDAISMGLNLPIQTLLFTTAEKFDGQNQRLLTPTEVQQIAGRSGRYGLSEYGDVGAIDATTLTQIRRLFQQSIAPIPTPFRVMANLDHILLVSTILEETSLRAIITFFALNMRFEGPFEVVNLESMAEAATIVDRYDLPMRTKYTLATAPLSTSSTLVMSAFERYVRALEQHKPIAYIPPKRLGDHALSMEELQEAEDRIKEISLYLWLSYRLGEYFVDAPKARAHRDELNRFIQRSLHRGDWGDRSPKKGKRINAGGVRRRGGR